MENPTILRSLAPRVAVVSTEDVDALCRASNIPDLAGLLRPFQNNLTRVSIRTSQLATLVAPTFPLRISTLVSLERSKAPGEEVERVLDLGPQILREGKWEAAKGDLLESVTDEFLSKPIAEVTPWYPIYRDLLLSSRLISEHETFEHPACVILAISSSHHDPLNAMASLYDRVNSSRLWKDRPYIDPGGFLRYFVVVHDVHGTTTLEEAQALLLSIKRTYGHNSSLLPINSVASTLPPSPLVHPLYASLPPLDPLALRDSPNGEALDSVPNSLSTPDVAEKSLLGGRLTDVDVAQMRAFLREMTVQSLVPFMERCVAQWNEVFQSSRRGLTGRLFGAGRKFFGSSRPTSPGPTTTTGPQGYNAIKGYYPYTSSEAVSRRLADFAFMLRDYRFAASVYDSIRKDYGSDKAFRYQAGATEMVGLSVLMTSPPRTRLEVDPFLEHAVQHYRSRTSHGILQLDAIRTTLLYYEGYQTLGEYRSVVPAMLRAAGEVEEIPSAILLEQAAFADLRLPKPAMRKFAFHLVLAAQRYEVCSQKAFSRRCFRQAAVLYRNQDWKRAQTHIEHALGRQAYTVGESDVAVEHFVRLLKGDQGDFLDDFVLAFEHLLAHHPEKISALSDELPEAVFDIKRTQVRSSFGQGAHYQGLSRAKWSSLEQSFLLLGFDGEESKRPRELLYSGSENIVSVGESFVVELVAHNPLDALLRLGDVTIIASQVGSSATSSEGSLDVETVPEILLDPGETRRVAVTVTASAVQKVEFTAVTFKFHQLLPCRQPLARRGPRLHITKAQRLTPTYAPDSSLTVSVQPPRPNLVARLDLMPVTLGQGETRRVSVKFINTGGSGLRGLRLLSSHPGSVWVAQKGSPSIYGPAMSSDFSSPLSVPNHLLPTGPVDLPVPGDILGPGESFELDLLVHGEFTGLQELLALFVYESENGGHFSSTASHTFFVEPFLELHANLRPSAFRPGMHLLTLELESFAPRPIRVTRIVGLSQLWDVSDLKGDSAVSSSIVIASGQRYRSFLTVSPASLPPDAPHPSMDFTALKLQHLLAGQTLKGSPVPPPAHLHTSSFFSSSSSSLSSLPHFSPHLLSLLLAGKRAARLADLASQYPLIPPEDVQLVFPLFEPKELDLIVFWETEDVTFSSEDQPTNLREGHILFTGMEVGPSQSIFLDIASAGEVADGHVVRSMFEATDVAKRALGESVLSGRLAVEEDPLRVHIRGPPARGAVVWDFGTTRLCSLPVAIEISNTSRTLSTRVTLTLQDPSRSALLGGVFSGQLLQKAIISPSSSASFQSIFNVTEPGTYDLASWKVDLETGLVKKATEEGGKELWTGRSFFSQVPMETKLLVVEDVRAKPTPSGDAAFSETVAV